MLQVYLCQRKPPRETPLPANITQHPPIASVGKDSITLTDGVCVDTTVLLLCTGYHYDFPFLSRDCHPQVEDERLTPLYKHLIHCHHPSLAFLGIPKTICPFPLFDCQVTLYIVTPELITHSGNKLCDNYNTK